MNFVCGPKILTPAGRALVRSPFEFVTSRSQYLAHAPCTVSDPSIVTLASGTSRIVMGLFSVPLSILTNAPWYVPPRRVRMSPGFAGDLLESAVARSKGFSQVPSPAGTPQEATQ